MWKGSSFLSALRLAATWRAAESRRSNVSSMCYIPAFGGCEKWKLPAAPSRGMCGTLQGEEGEWMTG
ncbi:hypothetical protein CesoFtcFv8_022721 [Champsocephalus esox]|uniref:Secreted protein n=1 Tax=Champsocephalus esox TaxID=159716 RepID=A0AAN8GFP8_9TELE|nr:hypothetical protein CesoFtcFv8_022721 [Champsocephalus esox]